MVPKHQNKRLLAVFVCAALLACGSWLLFSALKQNTQFFYNPSEILVDGFEPRSEDIRIGGLVLDGTVVKGTGLSTVFKLADFPEEGETASEKASAAITVSYSGILPDLFREGQGVVVTGKLISRDEMIASDVLAKHDENYQPKKEY